MLKEAILTAKQAAWSAAQPALKVLLEAAELQVLAYSRSLISNPEMDVWENQQLIAIKRAELISEAMTTFHRQLFDAEATAEAAAVVAYLQAHSNCKIVNGSMSNSGGPVVAPGQTIAIITYSP